MIGHAGNGHEGKAKLPAHNRKAGHAKAHRQERNKRRRRQSRARLNGRA